jgi:hypothetical protein
MPEGGGDENASGSTLRTELVAVRRQELTADLGVLPIPAFSPYDERLLTHSLLYKNNTDQQ